MLIAASTAGKIAFALGAAIVSFFLIRRSRRYLSQAGKSRRPAGGAPRTQNESAIPDSPEVMRGQVLLHDTARELMGELDSKMSALQALILMANEAADRLETVVARAERLGLSSVRDSLDELANLPTADRGPGDHLISNLSVERDAMLRLDQDPHSHLVLHLARSGKSRQAIADELGIPLGDVELLLSLHGEADRSRFNHG